MVTSFRVVFRIKIPEISVSPPAAIVYVEILVSSIRYVYGGNRSFAPILRQRQWSLLYDVY